MKIVVQKFGGSSVADNDKLQKVCERILEEYNNNKSVVVVVSAQGKTTDNLIEQEKTITEKASKREHDMLVTVGEQITIAKLAMMLQEKGYNAKSFLGWQVPIITNSNFSDADIEEIKTTKIMNELKKGTIVIVAGFQGVDRNNEITTIGRGGSDTTAIAVSIALNAEKCELFKDVDGIYSGDPHKDSKVIKYDKITYDKMLEYSKNIPVFQSSNMSFEINLMCDIVAKLAKQLTNSDIEIVETHHHNKVDAPSGTALMLANSINENNEYDYVYDRHSKKQKRTDKEIGISSIRGGTEVGKHTVYFFGDNESFEITHTVNSRSIFAKGAIKAAKYLIKQQKDSIIWKT